MSILNGDRSLFADPKDYAGPPYVSLIDDIARRCGRPVIIRCRCFTNCATDRARACSECGSLIYGCGFGDVFALSVSQYVEQDMDII